MQTVNHSERLENLCLYPIFKYRQRFFEENRISVIAGLSEKFLPEQEEQMITLKEDFMVKALLSSKEIILKQFLDKICENNFV